MADKQTKKEELRKKELEYRLYQEVAASIERGEQEKGIWAKAISDAEGNIEVARSKYIDLMVQKKLLEKQAKLEEPVNHIGDPAAIKKYKQAMGGLSAEEKKLWGIAFKIFIIGAFLFAFFMGA